MRNAMRLSCKTLFVAVLIVCRASGQSEFPIYTDSLDNNFHDWNSAPHSLTNTVPVHGGLYSIEVRPADKWQGIYFFHSDLNASQYSAVSFWVNGGTNGGQQLQVQAKLGADNPAPNTYYRFVAPPDSWRQIIVPLDALAAADKTNLTGIWIQLVSGSVTNPFYIDDVQLNPKPAPVLAAVVPPPSPTPMTTVPVAAPVTETSAAWWIFGALAVIIGLMVFLLVFMLRRSSAMKTSALVPVSTTSSLMVDASGTSAPTHSDDWQKRALVAEELARSQATILRDKVGSELTEFAKGTLVQGLYSQQTALIEVQHQAQQDLLELEARLAKLHLPLADRIQIYERRIAELEKKLNARNDEMRELTNATLQLVRQRLAEEKQRGQQSHFN